MKLSAISCPLLSVVRFVLARTRLDRIRSIDAKFPVEDYQRMLDAQDRRDLAGMEAALKGAGDPDEGLGQGHPDQVSRPAAHHRLRHHVPAHRGAVRRGAAPPRIGGLAAERLPGARGRPHHAGRPAQQPADGLPHPHGREALERGVAAAGGGQDPVRPVRRPARQGPQEAGPGLIRRIENAARKSRTIERSLRDRPGTAGRRGRRPAATRRRRGADRRGGGSAAADAWAPGS